MQEEEHLNKRRISDLELRSKVKCEADRNGKLAGIAAEQRSVGPYFQRPEQPANQQQDPYGSRHHLWASCQGSLIKFPGNLSENQCQRNLPDGIAEPRRSCRDFSLPLTLARLINVTTTTVAHPPLRLESTARTTASCRTETPDRMPRSD